MHPNRRTLTAAVAALLVTATPAYAQTTLLNVSYDPTRELYAEYNEVFAQYWEETTGESINFRMSHGGSAKQARSVIDGLGADVVTLAVAIDVTSIQKNAGVIEPGWQSEFPENSAPYTSAQVFLVRKGNPEGIENWDDLVREGVEVITPNPKTSGAARWNFLAAWGWADQEFGGDEDEVRDYMRRLYQNVPVLDTGARGATTTFVQRGIGDVLITYENEALRRWLRDLHDKTGHTTVFVTHDQEEAVELADRVVVLNEGAVEQVGTPDAIYDLPASPFVNGFIGEASSLPVTMSDGEIYLADRSTGLRCEGSGAGLIFFRPNDIEVVDWSSGCIPGVVVGSRRVADKKRLDLEVGGERHRVEIDIPVHHEAADRSRIAFRPTRWRIYPTGAGGAVASDEDLKAAEAAYG